MTTTNIRRWGNSQGLYIPIEMLRQLGIAVNSSVTLALENDAIVIRKSDSSSAKAAALASLQKIRNEAFPQSDSTVSDKDAGYRKEFLEYLDERYGHYTDQEND